MIGGARGSVLAVHSECAAQCSKSFERAAAIPVRRSRAGSGGASGANQREEMQGGGWTDQAHAMASGVKKGTRGTPLARSIQHRTPSPTTHSPRHAMAPHDGRLGVVGSGQRDLRVGTEGGGSKDPRRWAVISVPTGRASQGTPHGCAATHATSTQCPLRRMARRWVLTVCGFKGVDRRPYWAQQMACRSAQVVCG